MVYQKYSINSIRDLKLVYLYEMPYGSSDGLNPYYGLRIIYGNGQVLNYTHKDQIFTGFLNKVYNIYHLEIRENKIITVLGELSRKFLSETDFVKHNHLIRIPKEIINERKKFPLDNAFELQALAPFIFRFLNILISTLEKKEADYSYTIKHGYKSRNTIVYHDGYEEKNIPVAIVKTDDNLYLVQMLYCAHGYTNINIRLKLLADEITLLFDTEDAGIHGEVEYGIDYIHNKLSIFEEVNILNKKDLVSSAINVLSIQDVSGEEREYISHLMALSDIAIDMDKTQIYKINHSVYFIDDLLRVSGESHNNGSEIMTDINTLVIISGDCIAIKHGLFKFIYQNNTMLKHILDVADMDVLFKLIPTPNESTNYAVCQKYFNRSENANADYKANIAGRYADLIYTIPEGCDILDGILKAEKIEDPPDYAKRKYKRIKGLNE